MHAYVFVCVHVCLYVCYCCVYVCVYKDTDNSAVSKVSDRRGLNPQDRSILIVVGSSLAPVTSLLMPFSGPTDPVVHHGGLTGSAISHQ